MIFFCDYCNKAMTIKLRKIHNDGLQHKIAHANYWFNKRSPKNIMEIECSKKLCMFFFKRGNCKFGAYCQNTHYTKKQLKKLKEICKLSEYSVKKSITFKNEKENRIKKKKIKYLKKFYKNKNAPSLLSNNSALSKSIQLLKDFEWN